MKMRSLCAARLAKGRARRNNESENENNNNNNNNEDQRATSDRRRSTLMADILSRGGACGRLERTATERVADSINLCLC